MYILTYCTAVRIYCIQHCAQFHILRLHENNSMTICYVHHGKSHTQNMWLINPQIEQLIGLDALPGSKLIESPLSNFNAHSSPGFNLLTFPADKLDEAECFKSAVSHTAVNQHRFFGTRLTQWSVIHATITDMLNIVHEVLFDPIHYCCYKHPGLLKAQMATEQL